MILKEIKFAFYVLFHPFDGFWDMKHEGKGNLFVSFSCVVLLILSNIFKANATSFLFNINKFVVVDAFFEVQKIVVIFILFCIGNWSITTLMSGEGKFKDIAMVFGYSCLPVVLSQILSTLLSQISAFSESTYLQILNNGAWVWFFVILFFGIMTIHQYSLGKMVLTSVLTVIAMGCIVFIYLLFFSLITQMGTFIATVYKEIAFRIG